MKNADFSVKMISRIASALGDLNDKVIFVGGSVISLYVLDTAAEDVRPTEDIDITFEVPSIVELEALREILIQKGFSQSHEDNVICRFRYNDIIVDVMSTEPIDWAPSNRWFKSGLNDLQKIDLDGIAINILSLPYFLCTKFEAHADRGIDPRSSKDLEDITYLLDNVADVFEGIKNAPADVNTFLKYWFGKIKEDRTIQEAIYSQLPYEIQEERFKLIMNKIEKYLAT